VTIDFLLCGSFSSGGSGEIFKDPFPQSIDTFQRHAVDRNDFNMIVIGPNVANDGIN
jgi:hypothetical protein